MLFAEMSGFDLSGVILFVIYCVTLSQQIVQNKLQGIVNTRNNKEITTTTGRTIVQERRVNVKVKQYGNPGGKRKLVLDRKQQNEICFPEQGLRGQRQEEGAKNNIIIQTNFCK